MKTLNPATESETEELICRPANTASQTVGQAVSPRAGCHPAGCPQGPTKSPASHAARLLVTLFFSLPLFGQTTGTITGTVTDTSKAVMPGVKVTALCKTAGEHRETTTNAAGEYGLPFLTPCDYELSFSIAGFATTTEKATLAVTERIVVDAVMQLASVANQVEVTSAAPLLQTDSVTLGRVVDQETVQELPLATRNFTQLLTLSPGTSSELNNAGALGRGTQIVSASGARTTSNAMFIDGVDALNIHTNSASDNGVGSNGIIIPSPDAIQEFKVQTSLYDAQSGRSGGANISVITKTGGPQFHGSLFEFFRNEDMNANSFFFNSTGTKRAEFRQNQYGGTLGGPIVKNKTFFFLSYQGTRQLNGLSGSTSLTLPAIPLNRSAASLGQAFAGTKGSKGTLSILADGSNINPVALAILNLKLPNGSYLIPSPQISGKGVNYTASVPAKYNDDQGIANIDHQFSDANRLSLKMIIGDEPTVIPFGTANVPGFGSTQDFANRNISLTDTHIFSGNLVNEARIGVSRVLGVVQPQTVIPLSSIGMTRFNSSEYNDIPLINVSGNFEIGYDTNGDQSVKPTTYLASDTVSWIKGHHEIRAGIEVRHYRDDYYSRNRYRGTITLPSMGDFLLGLAGTPTAQGGNGSGSSNISSASVASGIPDGQDLLTDVNPFVQDTWKVNAHLTLTIGMRYDYDGFPVDAFGRRGNFDYFLYTPPPPGGETTAGFVQSNTAKNPVPGIPKVSPVLVNHVPTKNFSPRFGYAYKLTDKIVMRGGYGIFYDRLSNQLGLLTSQQAPNYLRTDLTSSTTTPYSLQNPFPILPLQTQFPIFPELYSPTYSPAQTPIGMNTIDPNLRVPYLQQWSTNIQWEAMRDTMGSKGTSLPVRRAISQALIATPQNPVNGVTTTTTANINSRVPYLGFSPDGLLAEETDGDSRYNSLQASVTRKMSHGLRFLASYTWSKSMDDTSGGSTTLFSEVTGDESNLASSKGPSDFDRTQRVVVNFGYEVPNWGFGWKNTALGRRFFGGWMLSGIVIVQSGTPYTVSDSTGAAYYGVTGSRANFAPGATLATAEKSGSTESRLNAYFNVGAFTKAGDYFGNAGRNILRGPAQRNTDFSVSKAVPVNEKIHAEFRTEFFNLFNFVNFSDPAGNLSSSGVGIIKSTNGNPRVIQLALKVVF